jgi:hypothetical protein
MHISTYIRTLIYSNNLSTATFPGRPRDWARQNDLPLFARGTHIIVGLKKSPQARQSTKELRNVIPPPPNTPSFLFSDSDIFAPSTKFVFYHLRTSQASTCFVHVQGTTAGPGLLYVCMLMCVCVCVCVCALRVYVVYTAVYICFCLVSAFSNGGIKGVWILSIHEASEVYMHSPLLTYICTYVLWPRK